MSPITRARLVKTIEYHESVSNHYKGLAGLKEEDSLDETESSEATQVPPPEGEPPLEMPPVEGNAPEGEEAAPPPKKELSPEEKKKQAEEKQKKDDLTLAKTHAEVVRQLRAVLDREPLEPAIMQAQRDQQILRDPAFGLRPQAGRFH